MQHHHSLVKQRVNHVVNIIFSCICCVCVFLYFFIFFVLASTAFTTASDTVALTSGEKLDFF